MASASSTETAVNTEQKYGDDPLAVRETDHYQEEYIEGFSQQPNFVIIYILRIGRYLVNSLVFLINE